MKNTWIILCVVFFGCNNANKEKSISYSEMEAISVDDVFEKTNYNQLNVIEEKLQDTYDLIYLLDKNSDFESSTKVSSIITPNIVLDSLNQNPTTVNNLTQIGKTETINDSTDYINFSYILKQGNLEKTDTLKAIIKKKAITIEEVTRTSIKIDFERHK